MGVASKFNLVSCGLTIFTEKELQKVCMAFILDLLVLGSYRSLLHSVLLYQFSVASFRLLMVNIRAADLNGTSISMDL